MPNNETVSAKRKAELEKQRGIQEMRRHARKAKRRGAGAGAVERKVDFGRERDFVFVIAPGAGRYAAYSALKKAVTLPLYVRKFRHDDAVQAATRAGRFECNLLFGLGQEVMRELAPVWCLGRRND